MEDMFDVQRDHVELLDLAMARLTPGEVLYSSSNLYKFGLDESVWACYMVKGITSETPDPDFTRSLKIHRTWRTIIC